MGKSRIIKKILDTVEKGWGYLTVERRLPLALTLGPVKKWWGCLTSHVAGRFLILVALLVFAVYCWSTVIDWLLQMTVEYEVESASKLAYFVREYYTAGTTAATIYVLLVSLPLFAGLWYFRTRDTLTQEKSTLSALNETLFHNASERLYHDQKQLRAEGLLTLKRLRDEDSRRFLDRVDHVTDRRLDLSGVILSGADLSKMQLANIIFEKAKMINAIFTDATLTNANLTKANLTKANLINANLTDANLTDANLKGANLTGIHLFRTNLTGANLEGANLTGIRLRSANLTGANLTGIRLTGANLTGANLSSADLTGANLTGANLTNANLGSANLTGANLNNADFKKVSVSRAKLPFGSRTEALGVLKQFDTSVGKADYVGRPDS